MGNLCVWENTISSSSSGSRSILYINLKEDSSAWNVTMMFDTEVTFEAWKGDVTKLSSTKYSVTSKCYNNILYACQCLELGYLVKHEAGLSPQASILYNGIPVPSCLEQPMCNGAPQAAEQVEVTSQTALVVDEDPEHPCLADPSPCHPEAICLVIGEKDLYNCTCPPNFIHTGADLFDSGSNTTACQVSSTSALNVNEGLVNETKAVDDMLNSLLSNASALDNLLIEMAQFEEADLEDFIIAIFNNTERTSLIIAAVGENPIAIMAVWDAIGNNTDAQQVYLEALGDLALQILESLNSSLDTLDPFLGS